MSVDDKIRKLCSQLLSAPEDSAEFHRIFADLKTARRELVAHLKQTASDGIRQREWMKPGESDKHQNEGRQPYRSREGGNGDGSAGDLKSLDAKKGDSQKKSE